LGIDEKQHVRAIATEVYSKPELDGTAVQLAELYVILEPLELSASDSYRTAELHVGEHHGAVELPATSRLEMGTHPSQAPVSPQTHQTPINPHQY
jgi:hypothetical protein